MLPALIGAGASLLGGILGNRAQKKVNNQNIAFQRENNALQQNLVREQNAYNDPAALRKRAEKAGFNPLLFVGPGVGQQMGVANTSAPQIAASNYMGAAVADAGMMIADQMSKNRELARLEKLSAENKKLAEKVQNLTIRPKVGGVYAQREAYNANNRPANSTDGVRLSGGGGADSAGPDGLRPIPSSDWIDPRREVEVKPVPSGSGIMKVENRFGTMYFPTIDGDEPLDVLDIPSFALAAPQFGYAGGQYLSYGGGRESRPNLTRAEALRLKEQRAAELAAKRPKPDMVNRWNNSRPMFGGGF